MSIERLSVTSSKPFNETVAALRAAAGHPDMAEFAKVTNDAGRSRKLETAIQKGLGKRGLMMFMELDQRSVLRKTVDHQRHIGEQIHIE